MQRSTAWDIGAIVNFTVFAVLVLLYPATFLPSLTSLQNDIIDLFLVVGLTVTSGLILSSISSE